ncbi:hypothetical protein [Spiribacter onubensis]|uniref:PASTA domain-containing protein n=2 Tax=Spiribacter onubensis TaxID=3122420 RepID=A0ABV3S998_9GAMM
MAASLVLTGLFTPSSVTAAFDCATPLDTVAMPADAVEVLRDETLRINDQPICYVGFETDMAPEAIVDRQSIIWSREPGRLFGPRPGSNDHPNTLFYTDGDETRYLTAIRDGESTAVTVSVISAIENVLNPPTPPVSSLPAGLRPLYEQRNRHGSTQVLDTSIAPAAARERLTEYLRDRGWALDSHTRDDQGLETLSMSKGERLIEIGAMPDGDRTAIIVNEISPGGGDE